MIRPVYLHDTSASGGAGSFGNSPQTARERLINRVLIRTAMDPVLRAKLGAQLATSAAGVVASDMAAGIAGVAAGSALSEALHSASGREEIENAVAVLEKEKGDDFAVEDLTDDEVVRKVGQNRLGQSSVSSLPTETGDGEEAQEQEVTRGNMSEPRSEQSIESRQQQDNNQPAPDRNKQQQEKDKNKNDREKQQDHRRKTEEGKLQQDHSGKPQEQRNFKGSDPRQKPPPPGEGVRGGPRNRPVASKLGPDQKPAGWGAHLSGVKAPAVTAAKAASQAEKDLAVAAKTGKAAGSVGRVASGAAKAGGKAEPGVSEAMEAAKQVGKVAKAIKEKGVVAGAKAAASGGMSVAFYTCVDPAVIAGTFAISLIPAFILGNLLTFMDLFFGGQRLSFGWKIVVLALDFGMAMNLVVMFAVFMAILCKVPGTGDFLGAMCKGI